MMPLRYFWDQFSIICFWHAKRWNFKLSPKYHVPKYRVSFEIRSRLAVLQFFIFGNFALSLLKKTFPSPKSGLGAVNGIQFMFSKKPMHNFVDRGGEPEVLAYSATSKVQMGIRCYQLLWKLSFHGFLLSCSMEAMAIMIEELTLRILVRYLQ